MRHDQMRRLYLRIHGVAMTYLRDVLGTLSCLANVLCGGSYGEMLSTRIGRAMIDGEWPKWLRLWHFEKAAGWRASHHWEPWGDE